MCLLHVISGGFHVRYQHAVVRTHPVCGKLPDTAPPQRPLAGLREPRGKIDPTMTARIIIIISSRLPLPGACPYPFVYVFSRGDSIRGD